MNKMTEPKILIVYDSTSARILIRELLKPLNAEIEEASDGQQGLDLSLETNFDLIITDINMPHMNGVELCRRLKNTPNTKGIPIIVVSSFDSNTDVFKGFQAGASAYVSKNDVQNLLFETVRKILSKFKFQNEQLIMVVDNSSSIRLLIEDGLAKAGFRVITAENGKKALNIIKNKRPDLVLSDINLPEMDGFALLESLQSDPDLSLIPLAAISTDSDRGHIQRMIQHGAASYIVKPLNMDQLVILIEKLLSDQFLLLLKERERLDTERNLMLASITSLIFALEARDPYTRGHYEAVAEIISGMLKLTGAGKLHDIGKIGVRDSTLLKPGRLSKEEFEHIMEHPIIGKGNEIPDWACMTAVADTYHALTSDRPYRKGMAEEKALRIINDVRGLNP